MKRKVPSGGRKPTQKWISSNPGGGGILGRITALFLARLLYVVDLAHSCCRI